MNMEGFLKPGGPQKPKENMEIAKVPEGWKNRHSFADELSVSYVSVEKIAERYRQSNPEYFDNFKNIQGKIIEYYSPELASVIQKEIKSMTEAPDGWETSWSAEKKIGMSRYLIIKTVDKYRQTHPNYFKEYKVPGGRIVEYYSPELVEILGQEFEKSKDAPEGWKTNRALCVQLNTSGPPISKIAEGYRKSNPEYFEEFRDIVGKVTEHYSPELVEILKKEFHRNKDAPEGWKTNTALSSELDIAAPTVSKIAEKFRQTNPEYFNNFKNIQGRVFEHYSPELVEKITNEIKKIEDAPEGWEIKKSLSKVLNITGATVGVMAEKYRASHPEYFKEFKIVRGRIYEHYSPELVSLLKEEVSKIGSVPEGWKTSGAIFKELNVRQGTVVNIAEKYRTDHPEYFGRYKAKTGTYEHYSPELIEIIKQEINEEQLQEVEKNKDLKEAPEGWLTKFALSNELTVSDLIVERVADRYIHTNPEYFNFFESKEYGQALQYYSPELVEIIRNEIKKFPRADEKYAGWKTKIDLSKELGLNSITVGKIAHKYIEVNPEDFKVLRIRQGNIVEHYSPRMVKIIKDEIEKVSYPPEGWKTNNDIADNLGASHETVKRIADKHRELNPEYFKEYRQKEYFRVYEYYAPELVEIIKNEINKFEKPESEYKDWKTKTSLAEELGIDRKTLKNRTNKYREINPEYFKQLRDKRGRINEYYSPKLVEILKQEIHDFQSQSFEKNNNELLKTKLEDFVQEIADPETQNEQAKKIGEILQLLPGNAHDIILKYHPEYKGVNVGYVKKIIAEYLGDFMSVKKEWRADDIEKFREVADIENIHEAILFNLKNACLSYINKEKKTNPDADERMLVAEYFNQPEMQQVMVSKIPELEKVINELKEYYDGVLGMKDKRPDNIVELLKRGRVFPDINQLINIKEMEKNKKLLIADEMGLGKSASTILTKEYLGLKCAMVIVPSNVVDTWKNYLSDRVAENGKQIGYFKNGQVPKVLVISSPADLYRLKNEVFDYVLISQERISGKGYAEELHQVDFDMMIVDEVHKLKNIETGVRSEAVMGLSEKIQGENKYLALLSGTPAPDKVKDIAVILKMLYPEKYKKFDNKEMVNRILYGDLIDLRSELLMRTQMKELASSIEIPTLTEELINLDLSPEEREIYEILLEEDELTASEKIIDFRQFLLNPELLKVEPGFPGSKVQKLEQILNEEIKTHDKIVVFVNGYVEGVIRGEQNIIDKMKLPSNVVIEEIHGEVGKDERRRIESEIKNKIQKMVLFVSGQTADVGVDFSGANHVIFYNEPWSKYDKKQQLARVYREGLKNPLTSTTLITRNSIEEGIRRYIDSKEKAIEKLLRGITNTDAEKKLLRNDSQLTKKDIETNAELSREYLSDWEKLMVHFGEGFEAGEKEFTKDLDRKGKEYADLYRKLGRLTYQGNNARVTASLLEKMIDDREQKIKDLRILDIASGPEMLREASTEKINENIFSLDINKEHFTPVESKTKRIIASYLNLPVKDNSVDYCNLGFAFHQTSPVKYHKKNYERLQVLAEMSRVLKPGGRGVISMLHNVRLGNEDKFAKLLESLGLKLVSDYSGEAVGGLSYKANFYTFEKVEEIPEYQTDTEKYVKLESPRDINKLAERIGKELLIGLEMEKLSQGKSKLKDQRRMVDKVYIAGKEIKVAFNGKDRNLYDNEIQAIKDGEDLKEKYGGIANIPLEEIKRIGFERKLETRGYYLLYKIIKDGGAVIVRGDYKPKRS